MNADVNLLLGLGLTSSTEKRVVQSTIYDHLFPAVDWKEIIVRKNGDVKIVVDNMLKVVYRFLDDTRKIAPLLKRETVYQTCNAVWDFWYNRCYYLEDKKGREQLRRPARSYFEGNIPGYGIDCDDFSIAVAQTLIHLNIPCKFRIAMYYGNTVYTHVYVVALDKKKPIIIDCVLDQFDTEKPFIKNEDSATMNAHSLNGIDIAVLSGISDQTPLTELTEIESLSGTEDQMFNYLKKTRDMVAENPELIQHVEHPTAFIQMLDYALKHWNTPNRQQALEVLQQQQDKFISGAQLNGFEDEQVHITYENSGNGNVVALGRVKWANRFFENVKEAAQKTGEAAKKAAKAVVKYNPVIAAARAGILIAFKTNLFHMAEHLKWGYLTPEQAKQHGFDLQEYENAVNALNQTKEMFVNTLQGKEENLREAILNGRAGNLNGISLGSGLGIEPVTTTIATTAPAIPFITKVKNFIQKINLKKLLQKVKPEKLKELIPTINSRGNQPNTNERNQSERNPNSNTALPGTPQSETQNPPPTDGDEIPGWLLPVGLIGAGLLVMNMSKSKRSGVAGLNGVKRKKSSKKSKTALNGTTKKPGIATLTGAKKKRKSNLPAALKKGKHKKGNGGSIKTIHL